MGTNAGTVTITGKGNYTGTKTVEFNIIPKNIESTIVDPIPNYIYNETAITPDIKVTDGSTVLTEGKDYEKKYSNNVDVGFGIINIIGKGNYNGTKTVTFKIDERPVTITGIKVSAPLKTRYFTGESIDLSGAKLTIMYDYSDPLETDITADMITGYNSTKAGIQQITVRYDGFEDSFEVFVSEPQISEIKVLALPKTEYFVGEDIEVSDGKIAVIYNDGNELVVPMTLSMLSECDTSSAGTLEITVTYEGFTDKYIIMVIKNPIIDTDEFDITDSSSNVGNAEIIANGDIAELLDDKDKDAEHIKLVVEENSSVAADTKGRMSQVLTGRTKVGLYLGIDLIKYVGVSEPTYISSTSSPVEIKFAMPSELMKPDTVAVREYMIIRLHDGIAQIIDSAFDGTYLTFSTDKFSDYAIAYIDLDYGDVNGDGTVNMADLLLLKQYMVKVPGKTVYKAAADVNADNNLLRMKQYMVKVPGVTLGK